MAKSSAKVQGVRRSAVALWRSLARDLFDPYRPELYYMRGPGPKWHAKQARPEADAKLPIGGSLHAA